MSLMLVQSPSPLTSLVPYPLLPLPLSSPLLSSSPSSLPSLLHLPPSLSSPISHLPSPPPTYYSLSQQRLVGWNDKGITQQLGHTPSIERYNIIEPP